MRRTTDKTLRDIDAKGPRYLPCPKRKDHADIAVEVCKSRCPHRRRCPVFGRWLRPQLPLG